MLVVLTGAETGAAGGSVASWNMRWSGTGGAPAELAESFAELVKALIGRPGGDQRDYPAAVRTRRSPMLLAPASHSVSTSRRRGDGRLALPAPVSGSGGSIRA